MTWAPRHTSSSRQRRQSGPARWRNAPCGWAIPLGPLSRGYPLEQSGEQGLPIDRLALGSGNHLRELEELLQALFHQLPFGVLRYQAPVDRDRVRVSPCGSMGFGLMHGADVATAGLVSGRAHRSPLDGVKALLELSEAEGEGAVLGKCLAQTFELGPRFGEFSSAHVAFDLRYERAAFLRRHQQPTMKHTTRLRSRYHRPEMMIWSAAVVLLLGAESLGPVLRQESFQLRPPQGFRMTRMDLFHGTQAGVVSMVPSASRYLAVALMDGEGEDAATLLIGVVDAPFEMGSSSRDELSAAVVRHLRDELGQLFQLERAEALNGRVEVLGSVQLGNQVRRVVVAAWPGAPHHVVALYTVPSGRWEGLASALSESFNSLKVEVGAPPRSLRAKWAFAVLVAVLLVISIGIWRRGLASRTHLT